jgi:hypothetical protein
MNACLPVCLNILKTEGYTMNTNRRLLLGVLLSQGLLASTAMAQGTPKVAVTDLAYQQSVAEYFEVVDGSAKSTVSANRNGFAATSSEQYTGVAGTYTRIDQGELRHFTADLKGAIIKGGGVALVQGKIFDDGGPQPTKAEQVLQQVKTGKMAKPVRQPDVNDIIARIKKGDFKGADYVLFGSVSSIDFQRDISPLQGTTSVTALYDLNISADFNLINTRTYEIKAAFTSIGNGNDTKIVSNRGDVANPNKARVIRDASKTLADDAYAQLLEQFGISQPGIGRRLRPGSNGAAGGVPVQAPAPTPTMVFK